METALWNGKLVLASEISEIYSQEKEIRLSSGNKELLCPDPGCQHPVVRYCHGEVKQAFFAHLKNDYCDYAVFDKEDTQKIRTARLVIYENFKKRGYNVQLEAKVLAHHYTHLLFSLPDGNRVAVEIGTNQTSAKKIKSIVEEYRKEGIAVRWIVLGSIDATVQENHTYFLKRYLLNESGNKDLLMVNYDGSEIAQYKIDSDKYMYDGIDLLRDIYPETYVENSSLDSLIFDDDFELSISGYQNRFEEWKKEKMESYSKKVLEFKNRSRKSKEQQVFAPATDLEGGFLLSKLSVLYNSNYEQRRQEILPYISLQQETQVCDSIGERWVKCRRCGSIETTDKFNDYGGKQGANLGICKECNKKK